MQRFRILLASVLLSITGVSMFGTRAMASPRTLAGPVPPQACSFGGGDSGGSTGGSVGVSASFGYSGTSGSGSGTSGGGAGSGSGNDSGNDYIVKHKNAPAKP